jgi:hypothetical protein
MADRMARTTFALGVADSTPTPATSKAVRSCASTAFGLANKSFNKTVTVSVLPNRAARCKGVSRVGPEERTLTST